MASRRLDWNRPENALARVEAERRARGGEILDLTESNPTRVGFHYPPDLLAPLADPASLLYRPAPRGLPEAREAIAGDYRDRGTPIPADRIVLSASSSDSYAMLFKLLADPGEAVLVPEPSYPLCDYLARLEGLVTRPYRLRVEAGWQIDFDSVFAAATAEPPARILVVVNPNNPTGHFIGREPWAQLAAMCADLDIAIISDEVFADYALDPAKHPERIQVAAREDWGGAAVFSLGGLSKSCGLPQLKLGWIAVGGSGEQAGEMLGRLDLVADTYLSVGMPVQIALPHLLACGAGIRRQIAERVARNRSALAAALGPDSPVTLLPSEGGWSAILRVPATNSDEEWALALLREDGVLVHPGYFFDMPAGAEYLVVSLLPAPAAFDQAVARLVTRSRR